MKTYTPRPYQSECIRTLASERAKGVKRGLVNMASGLGKTLTAAFDIEQFLQECPNAHVLVLCHREAILLQTKYKFQQCFGEEYSYGMYTGNYKSSRLTDFTFATFQTLQDHRENFAASTFDYIMVDEAHHSPAATYRPTIDYFTPQFLLGLTATPRRMDGQNLLDIYERELFVMDIYDGWMQDYLARAEYRIMLNDLDEKEFKKYLDPGESGLKVSLAQLNKSIFSERADADIVASIREQIADLDNPTVFVFCNSVAQAEAMAYHFGGEAAMIHSKQSFKCNQAILDKFYAGEIKTILSVDMLNEGIDIPSADAVVFLRATESTTVFFQQLGRGARITESKRTMRILDYVSNIERISMILEMEKTVQKRYESSLARPHSAEKLPPIEIKIPKVEFEMRRMDIDKMLQLFRRRSYKSREEMLEDLRQKAARGEKISWRSVEADPKLCSAHCYVQTFGSINNAKREANIDFDEILVFTDFEEACAAYYAESVKAGHWLSCREIATNRAVAACQTYTDRLGSIWNLRQYVGEKYGDIEPKCNAVRSKARTLCLSNDDIIQLYHQISCEAGHWLSLEEVKKETRLPSHGTICERIGGLKKMRQLAIACFGDIA